MNKMCNKYLLIVVGKWYDSPVQITTKYCAIPMVI